MPNDALRRPRKGYHHSALKALLEEAVALEADIEGKLNPRMGVFSEALVMIYLILTILHLEGFIRNA